MAAVFFYLGLGALLTLEEAGVFFLPGDISLVAAGLHGSQGGSFVAISWLAAAGGMVLGASVLFHGVGQASAVEKVMPARVVSLIRRHPVKGIAIARLFPGLRNATVFAAAGSGIQFRTFLYGLVPATMIWSGLLLALGWFGGAAMLSGFAQLHHSPLLKIVSLVLLLAVAAYVAFRLMRRNDVGHSASQIYEDERRSG